MKFKRFDKVIIKYSKEEGYIDAVVRGRYQVKLKDTYKWVDEWDIQLQEIKKNTEKSDAIRRMLGNI